MDSKEIERIEYGYLQDITWSLKSDKGKVINLLKTKDKIRDDWIKQYNRSDKKSQNGEMNRGAERVFGHLLPTTQWLPNSTPVGSDFMFESYNAFIHIDIKTSKINNVSDCIGLVAIGRNQTSFKTDFFKPQLPTFYNVNTNGEHIEKICLTYAIQVIQNKNETDIEAILLICIPNGELNYDHNIMGRGKTKGTSIRYKYHISPQFKYLDELPNRYEVIYFKKKKTLDMILKK